MPATQDGASILTRPRPAVADIIVTDALRTIRASRPAPKNDRSTLLTQQVATMTDDQYIAAADREFASDWACLFEMIDFLAVDVDDLRLSESLRAQALRALKWLGAAVADDPEEVVSSVRVHRRNGELPINPGTLPASGAAWERKLEKRMRRLCLN